MSSTFSHDLLRLPVWCSNSPAALPCRKASAVELPGAQSSGSTVRGIAFSPDGCYFLAGSDDKLARVWSTKTWELLNTWQVPSCYAAAQPTVGCSACAMQPSRWVLDGCPFAPALLHQPDIFRCSVL